MYISGQEMYIVIVIKTTPHPLTPEATIRFVVEEIRRGGAENITLVEMVKKNHCTTVEVFKHRTSGYTMEIVGFQQP